MSSKKLIVSLEIMIFCNKKKLIFILKPWKPDYCDTHIKPGGPVKNHKITKFLNSSCRQICCVLLHLIFVLLSSWQRGPDPKWLRAACLLEKTACLQKVNLSAELCIVCTVAPAFLLVRLWFSEFCWSESKVCLLDPWLGICSFAYSLILLKSI